MRMRLIRKDPASGDTNCPALYRTDRNSYVIVGRRLTDITGITTGIAADEIAVEIPLAVLTGMVVDPAGDATTGVAGA